jgi:RNA polymerase-binding transcription factor DksA
MSTNLRSQSCNEVPQSDGGVWYQLRSEREEICEALLRQTPVSDQLAVRVDPNQLQERLGLIDEALDRLMTGTYGDCIICGKWIEDNKLHADPALPFCCGCQRKSENKDVGQRRGVNNGGRATTHAQPQHHERRAWDG